ncbi:MAG: helix-turn-helix transcriptional regulator [Lachnospiraceae bacterium]|nr:helix-turn-helix transcriptional regulator [Lachnospiraceae bacterium]
MSFGNNLRLIRRQKGITQGQLADMLHVSRQAVSKWESDNGYPETDKLLMLAKKLRISIDYLLDNRPTDAADEKGMAVIPICDNKIAIASYDKSQVVNCLSVRYSRIAFSAKNEPKYILEAVDRVGFFGAHTIILGWYEDEATVRKEVDAILSFIEAGKKTYTLKYYTDVSVSVWGTASRRYVG